MANNKIGYYVKERGETIKNTFYTDIEINRSFITISDVENVCLYAWNNNDGGSWLGHGIILTIVINDEEFGDWEILIKTDPSFFPVKQEKRYNV